MALYNNIITSNNHSKQATKQSGISFDNNNYNNIVNTLGLLTISGAVLGQKNKLFDDTSLVEATSHQAESTIEV